MDVNDRAEDIVVLLELAPVGWEHFAVFGYTCMHIVKFEIGRRVSHVSLVHYNFQDLILKRCFLLIFDAFFPRDSPLLFSSYLFF